MVFFDVLANAVNSFYLTLSLCLNLCLLMELVGGITFAVKDFSCSARVFSLFFSSLMDISINTPPFFILEKWRAKNYDPVSHLSVSSNIFENIVNNKFDDYLEKCSIFSDSQFGFRSCWSTANLLAVVSDRITRPFKNSGATQAAVLDISKAFDSV